MAPIRTTCVHENIEKAIASVDYIQYENMTDVINVERSRTGASIQGHASELTF